MPSLAQIAKDHVPCEAERAVIAKARDMDRMFRAAPAKTFRLKRLHRELTILRKRQDWRSLASWMAEYRCAVMLECGLSEAVQPSRRIAA